MRRHSYATLGLIILLASTIFVATSQETRYSYHSFDTTIELQPRYDRYLVLLAPHISEHMAFGVVSSLGFVMKREVVIDGSSRFRVLSSATEASVHLQILQSNQHVDFAMPVFVDERGKDYYALNRFVVNFKDQVTIGEIRSLNASYGVELFRSLDGVKKHNRYLVTLPPKATTPLFEMIRIYHNNPMVEYASPDFISFDTGQDTNPNDTYFQDQWALPKVNAPKAWDITTGNTSIKIAVIDGGFDLSHEDLDGNFVSGYDFVSNDDNPFYVNSEDRHGTAVAGIIGAETNNSQGVSGLAWSCKLVPLRAATGGGMVSSACAQAFTWAAENGVDVINISHSGSYGTQDLTNQINYAAQSGRSGKSCVVVASAGNNNSSPIPYPGSLANVISVGSTTTTDQHWANSNRGSALDLAAPGSGGIWTTDITGSDGYSSTQYYDDFGGTSAAAPHVAAVAGLLLSQNSGLTRSQVQSILEQTAIDLGSTGRDDYFGWGRIDAWNAVRISTSGSLPGHEVWRGTMTLTGNVTIPSGVKLTVLSGTTVNLNGYTVKSTGGSFIEESNVTWQSYNIRITESGAIKGHYPTLASAMTDVQSGQAVEVTSASLSIGNDLTVASGWTLQISGNTTLDFSGNYKLRVEGKLVAVGTTSDTIRFTRSGGTWYGIEFYSGTSGSSIQYAKITNAQYGVYNYNTNATVSYSHIENNGTGVYSSNNSSTLAWNRIQSNSYGVQLASYGDANIQTNNVLRYNGYAVHGDATSVPALGNYPGNNSIYSNDYYDVYSSYGSTIYARGNWWGSYPASPSTYGTIDYSSELSSNPNTWAGRLVDPSKGLILPGPLAKKGNSEGDDSGMKELDQAYHLFSHGDYERALSAFQSIAEKYPDAFAGTRALVFADRILETLGRDVKAALVSTIARQTGSKVGSVAKSLMTGHLAKGGENEAALNNAFSLIDHQDKMVAKHALYDAGNLLWYRLNDKSAGSTYLRKLISDFPEDPLSHSALATLSESSAQVPREEQTKAVAAAGEELELHNYPNPFNPMTAIRYTIPYDGFVALKVYDLLGREMATLVSEVKSSGTHRVVLDATLLPSGIYVYQLESGGGRIVRKMLLLR